MKGRSAHAPGRDSAQHCPMFVRYYVEIPLTAQAAEHLLLQDPEAWLPGLATDATARAEALLTDVGFGRPGRRIEKQVQIEIGEPVQFPSKMALPIHWAATGPQNLFPAMDADVEVAPLGPAWTQLSISARYEPPLGTIGRAIDRALLHRVAEATVKDFLDRAGEALVSHASPTHSGSASAGGV
jgi:hypothetical protein